MTNARWETAGLDSVAMSDRDYWLARLSPVVGTLTPLPGAGNSTWNGKAPVIDLVSPPGLKHRLTELTKGSPFLLYTACFAALQICLYKYTGNETAVIGSPPLLESGVKNTLPMVDRIDPATGFKSILLQARTHLLQAYAKPRYPLPRLLADLGKNERQGSQSLHDVALALEGFHGDMIERSHGGMSITLTPYSKEFHASIRFEPSRFGEALVRRFARHWMSVLAQGLEDLAQPIRRISLLSATERHLVLLAWNDTERALPHMPVHLQFEAQAREAPDAVAVKYEDVRLTYGELNARANQLSASLRQCGAGPEVRVGILVERSPDLVVALLGVLKAGSVYVPLDVTYPEQRLAFMMDDAQVSILLTQTKFSEVAQRTEARVLFLDDDSSTVAGESKDDASTRVRGDNLAYVLYTSGSTGRPKGVMVPHSGLANYLGWCQDAYGIAHGQGAPVQSPIGFDLTVTSMFTPLVNGHTVTLLPEDAGTDGLQTTLREGQDFSLVKITPAHLRVLEELMQGEEVSEKTRCFVIGGEVLWGSALKFWQDHAPHTRLINEYGPTETVVGCVVYEAPHGATFPESVPIGRPINNAQIYLLDSRFEPVPVGAAGEVYVGGLGVARGYHNRPGLTAERFVPNPFSDEPGGRLYRTGDLAHYLPDGNLVYLGRADRQIKIRGYRIELGEIEAALQSHPGVQEAIGMVWDSGDSGMPSTSSEGSKELLAYVLKKKDHDLTAQKLKSFLSECLPDYMIPAVIMILDTLPLTNNGKVDYAALPLPSHRDRVTAHREFTAPRNRAEEVLTTIWTRAFDVERLGIHDNFFELGGHSLLAIRIVSQIRRAFQIKLPLRSLFDAQTVAGLAEVLDRYRPLPGRDEVSREPS